MDCQARLSEDTAHVALVRSVEEIVQYKTKNVIAALHRNASDTYNPCGWGTLEKRSSRSILGSLLILSSSAGLNSSWSWAVLRKFMKIK